MRVRLTEPQKRIWLVEKISDAGLSHVLSGKLVIHQVLEVDQLQLALNEMIENIDTLRLCIGEDNGEPFQYLNDKASYTIENRYFKSDEQVDEWIEESIRIPFQLEKELFRLDLCHLNNKSILVLSMHHIISDGWTLHLFVDKLMKLYRKEAVEYTDYLEMIEKEDDYFQSSRYKKSKEYWLKQLEILPDHELMLSENTASKRITKILDAKTTQLLNQLKEQYKTSYNVIMVAAYGMYDYYFNRREDIIYGIPVLNRSGPVQKNTLGMFTSTMPLRFKIEADSTIDELMKNLVEGFKKCLLHQRYPYNQLMEALNLRQQGMNGLFDTCINYYIAKTGDEMGGVSVTTEERHNGAQDYSFQLVIEENKDCLQWFYDIKTALYSDEWVEKTHNTLLSILKQIQCCERVSELQFESDELLDRKKHQETVSYPFDHVLDAFQSNVDKKGDSVAIHSDDPMTFKSLDDLSNKYAHWLQSRGIGQNDCIALKLSHSKDLIGIILGLYKVGGYYVPIDPEYPDTRTAYILKDAACKLLITDEILDEICLVEDGYVPYKSELAYILYTSGSTGQPKGVMVRHDNLVNYAQWAASEYMKKGDVFAFYSSIGFDLTITSMFVPLVCGQGMAIYPPNQSDFVLFDVLKDKKATVIKLTPSHLKLLEGKLKDSHVERMILGGENLTVDLCKKVHKEKNIELINEYGPTEATVGCMIHRYDPSVDKVGSVPIGRPAANTQILLLNNDMIAPNGVKGEIYIGGAGVTDGYLNLMEKTSQHFIKRDGKRYYRTGDFAKYLDSGSIEYLGRMDNQIKLNGHRIEIDEIDEALRNTGLKQVATKVWKKSLVSFYVHDELIELEKIKKTLQEILPHYMIPNLLIQKKEIPLTINGKIDYDALIVENAHQSKQANTALEKMVLNHMKEILNVSTLDLGDNFFYQGGDSIKAIQIASKLEEEGYDIKVKEIMASQSISDIVEKTKQLDDTDYYDQTPSKGHQVKSPILSWFDAHHFENEDYYNQSVLLKLKEDISIERINDCLNAMIKRHDIFRLTKKEGEYFYGETYSMNVVSSNVLTTENCEKLKRSLSLERGELIKGLYNNCELLLTIHHIAVDGISWRILLEELDHLLSGHSVTKPRKTSYQKWFENTEDISYDEQDWVAVKSSLPTDDVNVINERKTKTFVIHLDEIEEGYVGYQASMKLAYDEYILYHLSKAIHECFQIDEFVVEMEHHGRFERDNYDVSQTVGWFTVMYPVEVRYFESVEKCLRIIKDNVRLTREKGHHYMYHNNGQLNRMLRFNYLGEMNAGHYQNFEMSFKDHGRDFDALNIGSSLMDIDSYRMNDHLHVQISYNTKDYYETTIEHIKEKFIESITNVTVSSDETYLSVSDFEDLDMTLDELDGLFD